MKFIMKSPISGGSSDNGSISGVWALNLNNARTNSNDNVGLRADLSGSQQVDMALSWKRELHSCSVAANPAWPMASGSASESRHGSFNL